MRPQSPGGGRERRAGAIAILALWRLLAPVPALAQDASALVFLVAPPLVLAPLGAVVLRTSLLRRCGVAPPGFLAGYGAAWIELVAWLVSAGFGLNVYFAERWYIHAALSLLAAVGLSWGLHRLLLRRGPTLPPGRMMALVLALPASALGLGGIWLGVQLLRARLG